MRYDPQIIHGISIWIPGQETCKSCDLCGGLSQQHGQELHHAYPPFGNFAIPQWECFYTLGGASTLAFILSMRSY